MSEHVCVLVCVCVYVCTHAHVCAHVRTYACACICTERERERKTARRGLLCLLVPYYCSNMLVYLRDGYALATAHVATLR